MAQDRAGTSFGPYRILALIGRGGMGEVYRAHDTSKDREVALKLLPPDLAKDDAYRERFQREARLAARLQEPHVIPIHDFGEIDGVLYIDMRLVHGKDLRAVLRRPGLMQTTIAVDIVRQIGDALDAAHRDGLVHRDVKPENILLLPSGFAYLADFGIASRGDDLRLTSAGTAIGSFAYMAPERFQDAPVGPPADVYALGCVLYECLTGRAPFVRSALPAMIQAHLYEAPERVSAVRDDVSRDFDLVVGRALAKDPSVRFRTCRVFTDAALAALSPRPGTVSPPPAPAVPTREQVIPPRATTAQVQSGAASSARWWIIGVAVVLLVCAVLIGVKALASSSSAGTDNGASTDPVQQTTTQSQTSSTTKLVITDGNTGDTTEADLTTFVEVPRD